MIFIDELKTFHLYKRKFVAPIVETNKRKSSLIYLLTPNTDSTINILNHKLMDTRFFNSLYIERKTVLYVGDDNKITDENTDISTYSLCDKYSGYINENCLRVNAGSGNNFLIAFDEDARYDNKIKKLIWNDRIKTVKDLNVLYDNIKSKVPYITKTFYDINKYKGFNLFVDLSYYLNLFIKNNVYKLKAGIDLYREFLNRIFNRGDYIKLDYKNKTIIIDYFGWKTACKATDSSDLLDFNRTINPLSLIYYMMKRTFESFNSIYSGPVTILIMGKDGYLKLESSDISKDNLNNFKRLIDKLDKNEIDDAVFDDKSDSTKVIAMKSIDTIEKVTGIVIDNIQQPKYLTGSDPEKIDKKVPDESKSKKIVKAISTKKEKEVKDKLADDDKAEIVKAVYDKANSNTSANDVIDDIDNDEYIKSIIDKVSKEDSKTTLSNARQSRIDDLHKELLNKKISYGSITKNVNNMIEQSEKIEKIPENAIHIDSINEEWQHMKFKNLNSVYNPDNDIVAILYFLGTLSHPISVLDIKVEDTTTSEDYIETYHVQCETEVGKRFNLVFDVPKIKNGEFMRLSGNDKTLNNQLVLLPIVKTGSDTVQLVSNYKKIFIRRYGTTAGKSSGPADRLLKALNKYDGKDIKIKFGDASRLCSKYTLPYEYLDLSSSVKSIENNDYIIYFNPDEIRNVYNITDEELIKKESEKKYPLAYDKKNKVIIYAGLSESTSVIVLNLLSTGSKEFVDFAISQAPSTKCCYSMASILNTEIPVIVVLGYTYGLNRIIKETKHVKITDKAPSRKDYDMGYIKFKDGYIVFPNYGPVGMLFNGLKDCPTDIYSLGDMNDKSMWLDFLDEFGGRIKADGLDNFADLFVDPKTKTICLKYNLPSTYFDMLMYSNVLLCDTVYNKHVDLTGNRFRGSELIAGYAYLCISTAYGQYVNAFKRKNTSVMTMKRSAIIDAIMVDPTFSDLSFQTPLLEKETSATIGFKGLSGLNSDRAYGIDKRNYDETMLNKLSLSTGFASTVGLTRQCTIDMDVEDTAGTLSKTADPDDASITKTFSITEAMNPFSTTRDDPFRIAMTFIQSYKHTMRTEISHPLLVTNGADEALPYMTSDTFSWKAKGKGKIVEKTDDYMVIKYDNPDIPNEFVDLRETVQKNSDGGFFVTLKLDTDLKEGDTVKQDQIVAYDHKAYSDEVGATDNIAAVPGILAKVAVPSTEEGYEDSTIITDYLSTALASEVVIKKEKVLNKDCNVYLLAKKGDYVQEGDPILIFQNAYDDKDVNILLKNLSKDDLGDETVSDLGRITIASKYTGIIQDVQILRTCEIDEMSESLQKIVKSYESNIKKYRKVMTKYDTKDKNAFTADYKLPATGSMKDCDDGVKIIIYIKYFDKMSVGDKIVEWAALKGVVKTIPPVGDEMYSEYRPNEEVSSMFSVDSINGRMVTSVQLVGTINKGLIELDRQVKEIMGVPWKTIKEYDMDTLRKDGKIK